MRMQPTSSFGARWIFPIEGPPLPHGTLTIGADKILAVEPQGRRTADVELGNVAILPGFVNAHTHLDLTGARGQCPPAPDFTQWLRRVITLTAQPNGGALRLNIAVGLAECLRHGTTLIGDIAAGGTSWDTIGKTSCRAVVFHELLGLPDDRLQPALNTAEAWVRDFQDRDQFRRGLSPHAPYSVHRALFDWIAQHWMPVAAHVAETKAELELLGRHAGPFADFLKEMNVLETNPGLIGGPEYLIQVLRQALFVHGNYLDPHTPFLPTQTLVVCPRSHAAFGNPPHPFPHFLRRGMRVALGTDSLASNPDLDILAEARFLRRQYPDVAPGQATLWIPTLGARGAGFGITGNPGAGKSADFVVLPLPNDEPTDPHDLILQSTLPIERVMPWRLAIDLRGNVECEEQKNCTSVAIRGVKIHVTKSNGTLLLWATLCRSVISVWCCTLIFRTSAIQSGR